VGEVVSLEDRKAAFGNSPDGVCPTCKRDGLMLNVHKTHWLVCRQHKVKWCVGSNLYSNWQHETEEDWQRNTHELEGYAEVKPFHPSQPRRVPAPDDGEDFPF
jgi:hypothetical protein